MLLYVNETTRINTIHRESLHEINQDPELAYAAAILPTLPSLKSSLYRKRRERLPSLPATRSEVEFGGAWPKTMSGVEFLLGSQNEIFLEEADELYMDGTFRITPCLFYQVFQTVHAFNRKILLEGEKDTYNNTVIILIER